MVRKSKKPAPKRHLSSKLIWVVLAVLAIGAGSYALYAKIYDKGTAATAATSTTTQPKSNVGGATYSTTPLNSTAANAPNNARKESTSTTTTPPSSTLNTTTTSPSSMGIIITNIEGSVVHTEISGTTSGTCSLTATQTGQPTVYATSQVTSNNNSYECQSFNLTPNQFASGNWAVVVTLTSGGASATSETLDTQ